ncbi:MAG: hypothetical protein KatS3mg052_0419 [Candidatus Roseilinea sp.]|nr:MAG: hypothetical protein KatS3mg052_0419 [Candidatus Roseilinea sp.]
MSASAQGALPPWARNLDVEGYRTFIALVERYFVERRIPVHVKADEGVVQAESGVFHHTSVLGLQNVAQSCAQVGIERWPSLIAEHFDCIFAVSDDQNALMVDVGDFDKVSERLRARLYPVDLLSQSVETIHRPGPEGTIEVIVLDLPTTVRTISRSEAKRWDLEAPELFEIGRRNLQRAGSLKRTSVVLRSGVEIHLYSGDPYYAASHTLILDAYLPDDLPHGALVGLPRRDVILLHLIRNIGVAEAVGLMLQAIVGMYADGPGSLSPHLYWFWQGEFITLPYTRDGDALDFSPPMEFAELLERLGESAALS